jgi:ribosome biogenesis protein Nip4
MPAKGSSYQLPDRDQVLESNKKICETVVEDENGFKLPENLGYLCVIKYKTKKKAINWADTKKYGKTIYFLNLHSFGFRYHIKWFKTGISRFSFNEVYKFAPLRTMRTHVSKNAKANKEYHEWNLKDFWDFNKLEKLVHKKLKLEK